MDRPDQRLVRRYNPLGRVQITWTPGDQPTPGDQLTPADQPTPAINPPPAIVSAMVLDVSVSGMLLDLPLELQTEPGDIVTLSWDDHDAVARIAYTTRDEEPDHQLVGVEITEMSPEFTTNLYAVVACLRGDHGQLAEQWHRAW